MYFLPQSFILNALDEVPVISLAGQVLDTSFISRNQGKNLVYLTRKPFLERFWALYINKKLWFYEFRNTKTIFKNIIGFNFFSIYLKFNWFVINSFYVKQMLFLIKRVKYNYILNLNLLNLLSFNLDCGKNNPLNVLGLKNKLKNIFLSFKGSISSYKLLKNNLSGKLVKPFFSNLLKIKNERVCDNFFGGSMLKKYNKIKLKKKIYNKRKLKKIFYYKVYCMFDKLNFYNKILNLNLVSKLRNRFKNKDNIKAFFIVSKILNFMGLYDCDRASLNVIKNYKNRNSIKKLLFILFNYAKKGRLDWMFRNSSKLVVKTIYRSRAYSRKFNKWALRSRYKKINYNQNLNLNLEGTKQKKNLMNKLNVNLLFKSYNPLNVNININQVRTFQKFHWKTYLKPYFKPIGKKYFKRRKLIYRIRSSFRSKFLWGQADQLYKFTNNKRMAPKLIKNLAQELKNSGAIFLSGNLFKYHLWKYKKYIYLVTSYLSTIISYLLRNCIFKLFLFSRNDKFIYDIEILLYKFICIFYKKVINKSNKKKSYKKLVRYYLRSFSLNNNYIFI